MEGNKTFYLRIRGQKVEVSEEVFRAYVRPIRNEQRSQRRDARCLIPKEVKGKIAYVRCTGDCSKCEDADRNNELKRKLVSLEELQEKGFEIEVIDTSPEEQTIANGEITQLHAAIDCLSAKDRRLVQMVYFEGKSLRQIARETGMDDSNLSKKMKRILGQLKNFLKNF